MKRKLLIALALLLCLLLVFASCGGNDSDKDDDDDDDKSSSSSTDDQSSSSEDPSSSSSSDDSRTYTVIFDPGYDGAPDIEPAKIEKGARIGKLPVPAERIGWIFDGWYAEDDTEFKNKYTTSTKVTADTVLIAKWVEEPPCDHSVGYANAYATDATCESPAILYLRCRNPRCNDMQEMELSPALGHDVRTKEPVPANCINAGYTKKHCVRTGCPWEEITPGDPATGIHSYPEKWQVVRAATDYSYGQNRRGCKVCGDLQYIDIEPNKIDEYPTLPIKNVNIGGKTYVNVAENASALASSLYRNTIAANAVDGAPATFWRADTLVTKETYAGDSILITLATTYEVARIEFTIPNYWAWKLGDDFTVKYDIEVYENGAWIKVGTISDSDIQDPASKNAVVPLALDRVYQTDKIRATVVHATRYSPAMIYELQVFGYVENYVRVPKSIANLATGSITGSYNSWVNSSAANLLDDDKGTSWCTDARVWTDASTLIYGRSSNNITNGAVHFGRDNKQTVSQVVVTAGLLPGQTIDVLICRAWSEQVFVNKQIQSTDEDGNPLFDENGNPIMENVKDEEGNVIQVPKMTEKLDADGKPVLDGDGNPIMEEVWQDKTEWTSCGVVTMEEGGPTTFTFKAKKKDANGNLTEATLTDVVMVRVEVDNYGVDENKDDHTIESMTITTGSGDQAYSRAQLEWTYRKKVYATLTFPQPEFIAYIDIVCAKDVGRIMSLQFWVEDPSLERGGYWKEHTKIEVLESSAVGGTATFTVDIGEHQSQIRLEITKEPAIYGAYIFDISPTTVAEVGQDLAANTGCVHKFSSAEPLEVKAPTCTTAGYSLYKCFRCDATWTTDAIDMLGHQWNQGDLGSEDGNKVKYHECTVAGCKAEKTVVLEYRVDDAQNPYLAVPTVTKYYHNAPGAWSMTFDDGNYIDTYEWVVPEFEKRNFKATAVLTVQYSGSYTYEWAKYIASGTFDIGSHSQLHAGDFASATLDEGAMMKEIDAAHYIFASWFPGQRLLGFATPNGSTGAGTAYFVNDLMIGGRSGGQAGMYADPSKLSTREEWGNLPSYITYRSMTWGEYTDANWKQKATDNNGNGDVKACIEYVAKNGLWSIDCIHTIDTSPNQTTNDKFSIKKEIMINKLNLLEELNLWVGSYTQALQYFREAKAYELEDMTIGSSQISFNVTDNLDDSMFVQPLTFEFKLPTGWTSVTVTQNGVEIPFVAGSNYTANMAEDKVCTIIDGVLYFDVVPDAGQVVIVKK